MTSGAADAIAVDDVMDNELLAALPQRLDSFTSVPDTSNPALRQTLLNCFHFICRRLDLSSSSDHSFTEYLIVLKFIHEYMQRCPVDEFMTELPFKFIFKLLAVLNEKHMSADLDVQLSCLEIVHIVVSQYMEATKSILVKLNLFEILSNLLCNDEKNVQYIAWKIVKIVIKRNHCDGFLRYPEQLVESILDILISVCYIKVKSLVADIFLILLSQKDKFYFLAKDLNSLQILVNQIHIEYQATVKYSKWFAEKCFLITKYLWCLLQLLFDSNDKQYFRDIGGIPIVLTLLNISNDKLNAVISKNESHPIVEKYFEAVDAASTVISTLCTNEINNLDIAQKSGVLLLVKLLNRIPNMAIDSCKVLQMKLFRALRFLFSLERNRRRFRNLFPIPLYEVFVDVGHFCSDLNAYKKVVVVYRNLSDVDRANMKESIEYSNQKEDEKRIREYMTVELLGAGAFGSVYKAKRLKSSTESYCAIKEVNLSECLLGSSYEERYESIKQIVSEMDIIKNQLRHPNVVRYYRTFNDAHNLYVVMAFLEGISLGEQISCMKEKKETYNESRIWRIAIQLMQALRYLHKSKGIIHRDLTPNNIIIGDRDHATITDFGLAKQRLFQSFGRETRSVLGTLAYVCPEIIQHQPYGEKADIWALGCIVYQMCTLMQPFSAESELNLAEKICSGLYVPLHACGHPITEYSVKFDEFVAKCLRTNPNERSDVLDLTKLLNEEILINLDEIETLYFETNSSLFKERRQRKMLEKQLKECNSFQGTVSPKYIRYQSLRVNSSDVSNSSSPCRCQDSPLSNLDENQSNFYQQFCGVAESPDGSSLSLPVTKDPDRVACRSPDSRVSPSTDIRMRPHPLVRIRPQSSTSLISMSQKNLRQVSDDPISRILAWLHKVYFLSTSSVTSLKDKGYSEKELVQYKRYFKTFFHSIFQLKSSQMKKQMIQLLSGSEKLPAFTFTLNNFGIKFENMTSEELHHLMEDLLDKLQYYSE